MSFQQRSEQREAGATIHQSLELVASQSGPPEILNESSDYPLALLDNQVTSLSGMSPTALDTSFECLFTQTSDLSFNTNVIAVHDRTQHKVCNELSIASPLIGEFKTSSETLVQPLVWSLPPKPVIQPLSHLSSVHYKCVTTSSEDSLLIGPSSASLGSMSPLMLDSSSSSCLTPASKHVVYTTDEPFLMSAAITSSRQLNVLSLSRSHPYFQSENKKVESLQQPGERHPFGKFSMTDGTGVNIKMVSSLRERNSC